MNNLIQAAEIWVPDADGYLLEFGDGAYGAAIEFDTTSRALCFGRGEGLPGRVWDEQRPILLEHLDHGNFRRAKAAANAGYRAAVGLPFHVQGRVASIVVLFFGDVAAAQCAVELWKIDGAPRTLMARLGAPVAADASTASHVSLPIAGAAETHYELTLSGRPSTPIGHDVARASPDSVAMPRLHRREPDATSTANGRAPFGTLSLPVVVDEVVTGTLMIDL